MSNKIFIIIILVLTVGLTGFVVLNQDNSRPASRLGQQQSDKGRNHIQQEQSYNYDSDFPTSGPHSEQPAPWGAYEQVIPDENVIHSMEHGGVVITYNPNLDEQIVTKIEQLFAKPYSNPKFTPSKAIVMPGSKDDKLIVMRSWNRLIKLDTFNEQTMIDYYLTNVNKSPEPGAS